jgi:hypothetical protein
MDSQGYDNELDGNETDPLVLNVSTYVHQPRASSVFDKFVNWMNDVRGSLYIFLDDPRSSFKAYLFSIFIAITVIVSSLILVIETLPYFYAQKSAVWFVLEMFFMAVFSIEIGLRIFVYSSSLSQCKAFFMDPSNLIDLLALLPFYLELVFVPNRIVEFQRLSVFRLLRLFRLFKYYTYSNHLSLSLSIMKIAIKASQEALVSLLFFFVSFLIIGSTLLYFAERGTFDESLNRFINIRGKPSQFDSIPAAFWFVLSTMSTSGFASDMIPLTVLGRAICVPMVFCGLLFIALPSVVIGKNFTDALDQVKTEGRHLLLYGNRLIDQPETLPEQDLPVESESAAYQKKSIYSLGHDPISDGSNNSNSSHVDAASLKSTSTHKGISSNTQPTVSLLSEATSVPELDYEKFINRAGLRTEELVQEELQSQLMQMLDIQQSNLDNNQARQYINSKDNLDFHSGLIESEPDLQQLQTIRWNLLTQYLEESKRHQEALEKVFVRLKYVSITALKASNYKNNVNINELKNDNYKEPRSE